MGRDEITSEHNGLADEFLTKREIKQLAAHLADAAYWYINKEFAKRFDEEELYYFFKEKLEMSYDENY